MKKLISRLIIGAFFLIHFSFGVAQDLFEKFDPVPYTFLQKIKPDQTVGNYPILMVGNDWSLYQVKTSKTNQGQSLGYISAVDIRDEKFFAMYHMSVNLEQINASDWTDEPCKRNDFLYKKGDGFTNINCVSINYNTSYFQNPTGDFQVFYRKFRDMKLEFPPTVIRIDFTRYSNRGRRLTYGIILNPEAFGFNRDTETIWGANSWNKAFSDNDPKKVAFIAGLSKWADAVRDKMDKAFDHQKDAFENIPPLDSFLTTASN